MSSKTTMHEKLAAPMFSFLYTLIALVSKVSPARATSLYSQALILQTQRSGMALVVGVVALIAVAVAITIGYVVLVSIVNNAQSAAVGLTTTQSNNLSSIAASITGSFLLLTVLPVVVAAGLILGALFLFMHFKTTE